MTAQPSVLFVGESPPPGAPADFRPFDCASGTRLAKTVLGLTSRDVLLEHVPRANVFDVPTGPQGCPPWDAEAARSSVASHLLMNLVGRAHGGQAVRSYVLLGAKVADAFNMGRLPSPVGAHVAHDAPGGPLHFLRIPHPSGASTALNSPYVVGAVRIAVLPELVLGCPSLRPWHFRLDDPQVLADLAAVVGPYSPPVAAAALIHADTQHRLRSAEKSAPLLATARLAGEADPGRPPPWDVPLLDITRKLLRDDGDRELAASWHPRGEKLWLARNAKDYAKRWAADDRTDDCAARRAAILRYAASGVA